MNDPDLMKHDWYKVLGITLGESGVTKEMIEKSARKMSLKYHPDKTSDPKHHELFRLVQQAKDILLDDDKKKKIDEALTKKVRQAEFQTKRNSSMDTDRKRQREELESRIAQAKAGSKTQSESELARQREKKQKEDINKLRKKSEAQMEEAAKASEEREKTTKEMLEHRKYMVNDNGNIKTASCQVKIKWKRNHTSHSDESLFQLFKKYGGIEDIMLTGDTGNKAIIKFSDLSSAEKAIYDYDTSSDIRVTMLNDGTGATKKKAAVFTHVYKTHDNVNFEVNTSTSIAHEDRNDLDPIIKDIKRAMEREEIVRSLDAHGSVQESGTSSNSSRTTSITDSKKSVQVISASDLASKQNDVLAKMMAKAALKKKAAEATVAESKVPDPNSPSNSKEC